MTDKIDLIDEKLLVETGKIIANHGIPGYSGDPENCPNCDSEDLMWNGSVKSASIYPDEGWCINCGCRWRYYYNLGGIEACEEDKWYQPGKDTW